MLARNVLLHDRDGPVAGVESHSTASVALGWIGVILCAALLGVILGVGLSWALIRARTTGQIETQ